MGDEVLADDDATSRRVEGPTPVGGAYAIGWFLHDGMSVPQRYANQMLIVEYDAGGRPIKSTYANTIPKATLPPDYVPPTGGPTPPDDPLLPLMDAMGSGERC